jgi:PAS domain S-box-containing protein
MDKAKRARPKPSGTAFKGYSVAVVAVGLATVLRYLLHPILGDSAQYLTFYLAAMLAAVAGGFWPGLLATSLGAVLGTWLLVEPRGLPWIGTGADLVRLVVLLIVGFGVSIIAERLHLHRRRAETQALELQEMLDMVDLGHLLMRDMNDRIVRWTAGCERMYGYTTQEAVGRISHDLLQTEYPVPVETIQRHLTESGTWEGELRHRHKDGRLVTVASLWVLHRDPSGEPVAILESNNNISGLRRTEERLRLVLDAARVGTWDWDLHTGRLDWSLQCLEMFGVPPNRPMSHERFLAAVHPEDRQRVDEAVRDALERKVDYDAEMRAVWPDGSVHWVMAHGRGYYDGSGRPYRMAGAAVEITERKEFEEKLWSIAQFPQENPNPVIRLGQDGRVLFANEAAARLLVDLDSSDSSSEMSAPPVLRAAVEQALQVEREQDLEICCRRGRTFAFFCVPVPQRQYVNFYGRDVTEARQAEEALRESESFYRQTLESIPGMVFTTRPDGYCDYQSQQWEDYTGVTMNEMLGDAWNKLLHPDDQERAFANWRAAVEGRSPYDLEYRVRRYDGKYEWFRVVAQPIRDAQGQIVRWLGVAVNIEILKRTEAELQDAKNSAEHASEAKSRFLAVLSHELRTPLTPVLASVSMLQKDRDINRRANGQLEMIRRNVELEARLIDDLLDLTRIARGKIELNKSPVALCTVLQRAVDVCQPDIEARRLHFGVDIGPDAPYMIEADIARLQQVFWNLIRNSIKFTDHGGCVGVRCRLHNDQVVVQVNDSGVGIEPEALPHIFDAFAQANPGITRQFGGLGLGLAISKSLVEMHGGRIEAHSEGKGRGSTFTVRFPVLAKRCETAAAGPAQSVSTPPASSRPLRLLVVEDHGDTLEMLKLMLQAEGHEVETAGDVSTALETVGQGDFDVLLSDLGLPDGSGLDLIREVRARGLHTPAIALSGYGQEEDVKQSKAAGFMAHVTKPVDLDRLLVAVSNVASS